MATKVWLQLRAPRRGIEPRLVELMATDVTLYITIALLRGGSVRLFGQVSRGALRATDAQGALMVRRISELQW